MRWPGPAPATRPGLGAVVSRRVHGSCRRQLADTAAGGQEVLIDLQARRFFCGSPACAKTTFAEQVPGLATCYGRRTCSPQTVLQAVTMAPVGRASARLTGRLSCAVSRASAKSLLVLPVDRAVYVSTGCGVAFKHGAGGWAGFVSPVSRLGVRRVTRGGRRDRGAGGAGGTDRGGWRGAGRRCPGRRAGGRRR